MGFCSKVKIAACQVFGTPPYFCWQLAFHRHLPTSGRQNTVKTAPQPLIVNSAFFTLYVGIHILNCLDMRIHQVAPKIYHTYSKILVNRDWVIRFLGFFLVISEVGSQIYIANLAIFKILVFSVTFWHEITLYAVDIDKKRFRTPFLSL